MVKETNECNLVKAFRGLGQPKRTLFECCEGPLQMGMWVLMQAQQSFDVRSLNAKEIADIIVSALGHSITPDSITNAFKRAGPRIHVHKSTPRRYQIMNPGVKEILALQIGEKTTLLSFSDGEYYSTKRTATNIIGSLDGDLAICDPYCGPRTLDILVESNVLNVRLLTRTTNLSGPNKVQALRRLLKDFAKEYPYIQVRDYPYPHLHDRYILSDDTLLLVGSSLKDLGNKDCFLARFPKDDFKDVYESVLQLFNQRWKEGSLIA